MDIEANSHQKKHPQLISSYELGDCTFNAEHCELHCNVSGDMLHIEHKVCLVFQCLAQANGEVVTREELFAAAWPNIIVSDDSLNRCISVLRKKLKTFDSQLSIKTHPKVGFNLVYPHHQLAALTENESENIPSTEPLTSPVTIEENPSFIDKNKKVSLISINTFLLSCLILLVLFSLIPLNISDDKSFTPVLKNNRVAVLSFHLPNEMKAEYSELSDKLRTLIGNHSQHITIAKTEFEGKEPSNAREIGKNFKARIVITGRAYQENNRDILHWQIIDAITGDELYNNQINLALNSTTDNIHHMAVEFATTYAQLTFINNKQQHVNYLIKFAQYLFQVDHSNASLHPAVNLIARTITHIDENSTLALKALAELLTISNGFIDNKSRNYIKVAEKSLIKAISIDPLQADNYQTLAHVYLLQYQWQRAYQTIYDGKKIIEAQNGKEKLTFDELKIHTGQIDQALISNYQSASNYAPLNAKLRIKLAYLYMQNNNIKAALKTINTLFNKDVSQKHYGINIGAFLIRHGDVNKGQYLLKQGYLNIGISHKYIEVLIKGMTDKKYSYTASQILTQAANKNIFSKSILLQMYIQLNDNDAFFDLAPQLIRTRQVNLLSMLQSDSQLLRKDLRFKPIMAQLGLVSYWQKHGLPSLCIKEAYDFCKLEIISP